MRMRQGAGWEERVCCREMLTAQVGHGQEGEQQLGVVLAECMLALARLRGKAGQVDHVEHVVLRLEQVRKGVQ